MWNIVSWIVTGLIVGLLARAMMPGKQSMGFLGTMLLGIVGAFVGGLLSHLIWPVDMNASDWHFTNWLFAVVGGVVVLWGYLALTGRRNRALTTGA